jgi:hypothetical protein
MSEITKEGANNFFCKLFGMIPEKHDLSPTLEDECHAWIPIYRYRSFLFLRYLYYLAYDNGYEVSIEKLDDFTDKLIISKIRKDYAKTLEEDLEVWRKKHPAE